MILQSVLFTEDECKKELYYRYKRSGVLSLDTYLNFFSVSKWRKYTSLNRIFFYYKSIGYTLISFHDLSGEIFQKKLNSGCVSEGRIELEIDQMREACWVTLIEGNDKEKSFEGYFGTDEIAVRQPKVVVDICSYKREEYLKSNLKKIQQYFFERESEFKDFLYIYVVDNSSELEIEKYENEHIKVFHNKNLGGAGGFTRGLIEILKAKKEYGYTHAILMDDDIEFEPEAIARTISFLSYIKPEYENITVGGTMLRLDKRNIVHASGESWSHGLLDNSKKGLDLADFNSCLYLEQENRNVDYSGWWYCCISLNVVSEDNLPLALFIHLDDIEFGIRNSKWGIVFINGVSVWHSTFLHKRPSIYEYYELRNNLILRSTLMLDYGMKEALKVVIKRMIRAILYFRYDDAKLNYLAVCDFLRGVEHFEHLDGVTLHKKISGLGYHSKSIYSLGLEEDVISEIENYDDTNENNKRYVETDNRFGLKEKLTLNGWLLPVKSFEVIPIPCGIHAKRMYRVKSAILYNPDSKDGVIVKKSWRGFFGVVILLFKVVVKMLLKYSRVSNEFRKNSLRLRSIEFWKVYLGIKS